MSHSSRQRNGGADGPSIDGDDLLLLNSALAQQAEFSAARGDRSRHSAAGTALSRQASSSAVLGSGTRSRLPREHSIESFTDNDEELLMHELAALASAPAPFVSGEARRKQAESASASSSSPSASPQPRRPPGATSASVPASGGGLDEEQAVLDAILGSIDYQQQQSSLGRNELASDIPWLAEQDNWPDGHDEADDLSRVLAHAEAAASAGLQHDGGGGCRKGDCILSFHEPAALRRTVDRACATFGNPTCVALRPAVFAPPVTATSPTRPSKRPRSDALRLVLGTTFGAMLLFDARGASLGICGSADSATVTQRGAVVSLSLPALPMGKGVTVASGHQSGTFILWSVESLAPLRIIVEEFTQPVLSARHLFCDAYRVLCLCATGSIELLSFTRVLATTVLRSTSVAQGHPALLGGMAAIADFDALPQPTLAYLRGGSGSVKRLERGEVPVLLTAVGPDGAFPGGDLPTRSAAHGPTPFVVPGSHLLATVSAGAVLLHSLETGLVSVAVPVAYYASDPESARSRAGRSQIVRFIVNERGAGGLPAVQLCVSWGLEAELVQVVFDNMGNATALHPFTSLSLFAPALNVCAVAGCSLIAFDLSGNLTLFDGIAGLVAEQHSLPAFQLHPTVPDGGLWGPRYGGSVATDGVSAVLLGPAGKLLSCALLPWGERLRALTARRRYGEALGLVKDLAEEVCLSAVGLSGDAAQRRASLQRFMSVICVSYIRDTAASATGTEADRLPSFLYAVLEEVVLFCSRVDELQSVLFGPVMQCVREIKTSPVAFLVLERALLAGVVTAMPELYIETFFHFFSQDPAALAACTAEVGGGSSTAMSADAATATGMERAEAALMHMETSLGCVERIAIEENLPRLRVTLLSLRQGNYGDALKVALAASPALALDYIDVTLRGATLLTNTDVPDAEKATAKRQVWMQATSSADVFSGLMATAQPPARFLDAVLRVLADGSGPFSPWTPQHLTLSVRYNVAKVFALLIGRGDSQNPEALLFGQDSTGSFNPWELAQTPPVSSPHALSALSAMRYFIDGLVNLIAADGRGGPSFLLGSLTTLVEWTALTIVIDANYVHAFQTSDTPAARLAAQLQLVKFIRAVWYDGSGASLGRRVDFTGYCEEFRRAGMARCLAAVHCMSGAYGAAIDCYLDEGSNRSDRDLSEGVFALLRAEVARLKQLGTGANGGSPSTGPQAALRDLRMAVMDRIGQLVLVDATSLAQFIFDFLPSDNDEVMKVLKGSSKTFLRYLDELLESGNVAVGNDVNLQTNYLELLCAHEPARVYPYLKERDSAIAYDMQAVLKAVRRYKVADAAVYLLEKTLMVEEAMNTLIAALRGALQEARVALISALAQQPVDSVGAPDATARSDSPVIGHLLAVGAELLSSYQARTSKPTVSYWFRLLDSLSGPRRVLAAWEAALERPAEEVEAGTDRHHHHNPAPPSFTEYWTKRANEVVVSAAVGSATSEPPALPTPLPPVDDAPRSLALARAMAATYTECTALLLQVTVRTVELSVLVAKIVQDNQGEMFGLFKPIIVDIMSAIRFDLDVKRLCLQCVEEDLLTLGGSLYRRLSNGIVAKSHVCNLCRRRLDARPPSIATDSGGGSNALATDGLSAGSSTSAVCVFACGHGFHESCRAAAASAEGRQDCIRCHLQRAGEVSRGRYDFIALAAARGSAAEAAAAATGESSALHRLPRNAALLARRLRNTRAKIDNTDDYYGVLKGFLATSKRDRPARTDRIDPVPAPAPAQAQTRLVRTPAPPLLVSLGVVGGGGPPGPTAAEADVTATLTDAEIIELFGG